VKALALRVLAAIAVLAVWEALPRTGLVNASFLTPASEVLGVLRGLAASGELARHAAVSLRRVAYGLAAAVAVGAPLGLALGSFRSFELAFDGPLQAGRQVSAIALFPVFILFFGIGEVSKTVIIFWASVWPVLLNTVAGVKGVDPVLVKSARSMSARGATLFRKVVLPAAAPSIFTGVRLGAAYAFMVLVAAEMIGANAGLGFLVLHSQETFAIPQMYAAIAALAASGLAVNAALLAIERHTTSWRDAAGS
jgi:NitT/TauT family transport system permease protein